MQNLVLLLPLQLVFLANLILASITDRIESAGPEFLDISSVCPCAQSLSRDAEYLCNAATQISNPNANCTQWRVATNLALAESACNNCTKVAEYVKEICTLQLTPFTVPGVVEDACTYAMELIESGCGNACLMSPTFCTDPTSTELTRCQTSCGDYFGCRCYQVKGTLNFQCYGSTLSGKSCFDLLEQDNLQVGSTCGAESACYPYFVCPTDRCLAFNIQCPAPSDCFQNPGVCDPSTGVCSFYQQPDGFPCDDGLFYTKNEQCVSGQCIGVADVCLQYNVQCKMPHNPCVQAGTCISKNGDCRFVKTPAGTPCDDGDFFTRNDQCDGKGVCKGTPFDPCEGVTCQVPADEPCILSASCLRGDCIFTYKDDLKPCAEGKVCAEGRCLPSQTTLFAKVGDGHCVDKDNEDINQYYNDVSSQEECSTHCLNDPLCIGYSYVPFTGRTCFIYAPERTRAALNFWAFQGGHSGLAIKGMKSLGSIEEICYTRAQRATKETAVFGVDDYFISPMGFVIFVVFISALWLLYINVYYTQVNAFFMRAFVKIKSFCSKKRD